MQKLIVSDVSGILTERGCINTKVLNTFKSLNSLNYTFATGKGYLAIKQDIGNYLPENIIVENGALIISREGKIISKEEFYFNKNLIETYFTNSHVEFMACVDPKTQRYNFLCREEKFLQEVVHKNFYFAQQVTTNVDQFLELTNNKCLRLIIKMSCPVNELKINKIEGLDYSISETYYLNICKNNVNKAYAIKKICKILGIKLKDVICIGNDYNDIVMFELPVRKVLVSSYKPIPPELNSLADDKVNIECLSNFLTLLDNKKGDY